MNIRDEELWAPNHAVRADILALAPWLCNLWVCVLEWVKVKVMIRDTDLVDVIFKTLAYSTVISVYWVLKNIYEVVERMWMIPWTERVISN